MTEREAILDFANALEAAAVKLKHELGVDCTKKPAAAQWDPIKIKWIEDVGKKGPYEKAESGAEDYQHMIKDLQDHQGKLNHEGRFYWLFQDNKTVGRTIK